MERMDASGTSVELQTLQILTDTTRARGIAFERDELEIGEFEQMPGLATGRGARVEHAHAVAHVQERRRALGAGILYRNDASSETGNRFDR